VVRSKGKRCAVSEKATFAAGCFWGVEATFRALEGVEDAVVGYTGGTMADPSYKDVCTGDTGHAEAVQVTYDPSRIPYSTLLQVFFDNHDPTTLNRQGPDVGTQYRSAIFTENDSQREQALAAKQAMEASGRFKRPIVTQILPAAPFYRAEEYHQRYLEKRGLAHCHIK
jgi:peptide-methionine (S)-S-oxide reductase